MNTCCANILTQAFSFGFKSETILLFTNSFRFALNVKTATCLSQMFLRKSHFTCNLTKVVGHIFLFFMV